MPIAKLAEGNFYRNGLGQPVMIAATLPDTDRRYRRGLRFVDHRGSLYSETGSVQSSFYHKLDLVEELSPDDLSARDQYKLAADVKNMVEAMVTMSRVHRFCRTVITNASAASIIIGLIRLSSRPREAILDIAVGVGGLTFNEYTSENLYSFQ